MCPLHTWSQSRRLIHFSGWGSFLMFTCEPSLSGRKADKSRSCRHPSRWTLLWQEREQMGGIRGKADKVKKQQKATCFGCRIVICGCLCSDWSCMEMFYGRNNVLKLWCETTKTFMCHQKNYILSETPNAPRALWLKFIRTVEEVRHSESFYYENLKSQTKWPPNFSILPMWRQKCIPERKRAD